MFGVTAVRIRQILRENGINSAHSNYMNFSEEDRRRIVDLYLQGVSSVKLGEMFNCSRNPIVRILHENGINLCTSLIKIPKDDYQKVAEMYNGGMLQSEIADVYECSTTVVSNVLKQMNVTTRTNSTPKERAEDMYELYKTGMKISEISKLYNIHPSTVGSVFKRNGFPTDRKTYHCDEHFFDTIDTQEKAYCIGLLWSDGCNQLNRGTVTIQLQERDIGILEQIKEVSNNERPLYKTMLNERNSNWQNAITLTWQSKHISQVLNDYGMVPRKSLVLKFPEWLDEKLYPHFLRGYCDGDGSIYYSKDRNTFRVTMVGTKMFLDVVQNIFKNIGIKTLIYHKNGHNDITYTLSTTSNIGTLHLLNWMYENANLKLQRKYEKYQQAFIKYDINNSLAN